MKNFVIRLISAITVIVLILLLYTFFKIPGLQFLCFLAPLLGGLELGHILLPGGTTQRIRWFFYISILSVFLGSIQSLLISISVLSLVMVFFSSMVLLWSHEHLSLEQILNTITRSVYGFVYLGVFPAFAYKLLEERNGVQWFAALLTIVLLGDVMAYLVGMRWGSRKIIPRISPKKSLAGVLGGILGSLIGGLIFYYILPDQKIVHLLLLSIILGGIAQYGDFFESLMKRVADIKDSGSIMPGHGGVLDRIDGILFAAPVVYIFVQFLSSN